MITSWNKLKYGVVQKDQYVFKIGDRGDKFYIILSGSVSVLIPDKKYTEEEVISEEVSEIYSEAESSPTRKPQQPGNKPRRLNEHFFKAKVMKLVSNKILINKSFQNSSSASNPYLKTLIEDRMLEVAVLSNGQSFGELALISNKPRAASIRAKTTCYFAILNKEDYQNVYGAMEQK